MFRYPDKPQSQLAASGLADLPEVYIAQLKMDGWRCVVERTANGFTFTRRHKKPIPISGDLAATIGDTLHSLPVGTILDGEWLARRPGWRSEALWLFDMMHHDQPLWSVTLRERLALMAAVVPAAMIPPMVSSDYGDFFDAMRPRGDGEGIVLKRADSRYIGSVRSSGLNPGWLKAKWRGGEDGCTMLDQLAAIA